MCERIRSTKYFSLRSVKPTCGEPRCQTFKQLCVSVNQKTRKILNIFK